MALSADPNIEVGIIGSPVMNTNDFIGLGDMGRLYARLISKAGWKYEVASNRANSRVNACDRPEKFEQIKKDFEGVPLLTFLLISGTPINIVENGHLVSRRSDLVFYSVEAEYIDQVVKAYGPCMFL
jgi:prephenate dehydrogenase (NADP+)